MVGDTKEISLTHVIFFFRIYIETSLGYILNSNILSSHNLVFVIQSLSLLGYFWGLKTLAALNTGRSRNDHSKHEQPFAHKMHPIICIVVVHWTHQLPMHGLIVRMGNYWRWFFLSYEIGLVQKIQGLGHPKCQKLSLQALFSFLVLEDASRVSGHVWKEETTSSTSPKSNIVLYKHLRACTNYLEMYGKWLCIHAFNIPQ